MDQPAQETWRERPVLAGVLVGGANTRMGCSKATLCFEGRTFVERIVSAVRHRAQRVVLLGDETPPAPSEGITTLRDAPGVKGPLAGMLAALRWAREACWIFAACDLPMLRPAAIDWLLEQRRADCWAVLPRLDDAGVEPLLAVYEPQSLVLLERMVARGVRSPHKLAGEPHVCSPTPPVELRICWTNVNTPEELRRLAGNSGSFGRNRASQGPERHQKRSGD